MYVGVRKKSGPDWCSGCGHRLERTASITNLECHHCVMFCGAVLSSVAPKAGGEAVTERKEGSVDTELPVGLMLTR